MERTDEPERGSRSFTRYGYGDLLKKRGNMGSSSRLAWTQRFFYGAILSLARLIQKHSDFAVCGSRSDEPLSFKGRRGSGIAGDRCGYLDTSLKQNGLGKIFIQSQDLRRLTYNRDRPGYLRRYLKKEFGNHLIAVEMHLQMQQGSCDRPTVHGASAGNNTYWPECIPHCRFLILLIRILITTVRHPEYR